MIPNALAVHVHVGKERYAGQKIELAVRVLVQPVALLFTGEQPLVPHKEAADPSSLPIQLRPPREAVIATGEDFSLIEQVP